VRIVSGQCSKPKAGETVNGDRAFVRSGKRDLFAVIDALGHGPAADNAARIAIDELESAPEDVDLETLVQTLHTALRGSRGIALTVLCREGEELSAVAVGNVALRTVRGGRISLVPVAGVVGGSLRRVKVARGALLPESRFVLHSDGVSTRFSASLATTGTADEAASALVDQFGSSTDDATALVIDCI
jgi:negative regulator of sigma-B (phosphoserine phosphatase)